jgi:hypothetical protein
MNDSSTDARVGDFTPPQTQSAASAALRRAVIPRTIRDYLRAVIALGDFNPSKPSRIASGAIARETGAHIGSVKRMRAETIQAGLLKIVEPGAGRGVASLFVIDWARVNALTPIDEKGSACATVSAQEKGSAQRRKGSAENEKGSADGLEKVAHRVEKVAPALPTHYSIRDSCAFASANAMNHPGERSCSGNHEPPNRSEPDDEDARLSQIAREIIGPAVGLGINNIPAVRIGEIVRASGGFAVNGRERAEWGGAEPLDRARMLRAGLDVGLARMNGCRGMQALHTVRRVAIAAMHDAIPAGEYPAVFDENHKGPKFEKIEGW